MKSFCILCLSLSFALLLAGCAASKPATPPPALEGTAWVLASLPGRSLVAGATPTARFEDGRVAGSDGCNRYMMPFTASGATLAIGPQGPSTSMACAENVMAQASAFTTGLLAARSFRRDADKLILLDASGAVVMTLASQAATLAGTRWNVTMINNGRQAIVSVVTGSTVTLAFDAQGRASGSTGCNQFTAGYQATGETLRFSQVASTRRACADPAVDEQEQAFLRALGSVASLQFEADRLELRDPDGSLALILLQAQ